MEQLRDVHWRALINSLVISSSNNGGWFIHTFDSNAQQHSSQYWSDKKTDNQGEEQYQLTPKKSQLDNAFRLATYSVQRQA